MNKSPVLNLTAQRVFPIRLKLALAFAGLAVLSAALFSGILFFSFRSQMRNTMRENLKSQVAVAALQIDGDVHQQIQSPEDLSSPAYQQILQSLNKIYSASEAISYPYTVRLGADGKAIFVVDSTNPDPSQVGEVYEDPGPVLAQNLRTMTRPTVEDELYTDDFGTWLSGYAPIYRSDGKVEAVLAFDISAEDVLAQERKLLYLILAIFAVTLPLAYGIAFWLSKQITRPVIDITETARQIAEIELPKLSQAAEAIAAGDLTFSVSVQAPSLSVKSNDELGQLANALNRITARIQETGQAVNQMTENLSRLVGEVANSAANLGKSSVQLTENTDLARQNTRQIASAIQQAAEGTLRQSDSANQTAASVSQMTRAIQGVASGAQEQSAAVNRAAEITGDIAGMVRQVDQNAQSVIKDSAQASNIARLGASTVQETVLGMQRIQEKVDLSTTKVKEMGQRSENIGLIVETIEEIASQTNLLALNAAIETARAESLTEIMMDAILNQQMTTQAQLLNQILLANKADCGLSFWQDLARRAHIDTLSITDADGVIVYSNEPEVIGWRFPEDPASQANEFRKLIGMQNGVICQKAQRRSSDQRVLKYVGVSRLDEPGVVQIAFDAGTIRKYKVNLASFGVVADEVRKLAERSGVSTREIGALVKGIQKVMAEAVAAMKETVREVESGVALSKEAGQQLGDILSAAESVYKQAELAAGAVQRAMEGSHELAFAMDRVSAVVEENIAATEEMSAGSAEVTQAVEDIAAVGKKNSGAFEEISDSTQEMSAQVESVAASAQSLEHMARLLEQTVAEFKLKK